MGKIVKSNLNNVSFKLPTKVYDFCQNPVEAIVNSINNLQTSFEDLDYDKLISKIENLCNYELPGNIISIFDYFLDEDTDSTGSDPNSTPSNSGNGANLKDGTNIIDTSQPYTTGNKYNLSEEDLRYLAYIAYREQGSVEGAKIELSLMANLYEKNKSRYSSVVDYVKHSGWFGSAKTSYSYPGDSYLEAAREVMNGGNRYLASNVVEHDCISDISSISTGSRSDRSAYIPGETIIRNVYGAKYVFVGFAPNGGDPFGYLVN